MEFTLASQTETKAVFQLRDTTDTKKIYPYSFQLSLSYTLEDGVLNMEYLVENTDSKVIYYCLGAHPAKAPFLCIEPWNGSAVYAAEDDEFIHKNHVQALPPKASKSYRMAIRILKGCC